MKLTISLTNIIYEHYNFFYQSLKRCKYVQCKNDTHKEHVHKDVFLC